MGMPATTRHHVEDLHGTGGVWAARIEFKSSVLVMAVAASRYATTIFVP